MRVLEMCKFCYGRLKNYTLCNEDVYLECFFNKQLWSDEYLIVATVLLILIFMIGIAGNICVCVVILKQKEMRKQNNTNYYLFNLAVSDLLLLIFGLPQEVWTNWHVYPDYFGYFMCKLRFFISETTTYSSLLTVAAFSIERYIAICHPLVSCNSGPRRAVSVILGIWTLSIATAIPLTQAAAVVVGMQYPGNAGGVSTKAMICGTSNGAQESLTIYLGCVSVFFFFIPMMILTVVYIRIGVCIRSRQKMKIVGGIQGRIHAEGVKSTTAIGVLAAVVVIFFLCWAPFHFQRIANSKISNELRGPMFVISGVLYYLSASVNPILYNVMSRRYRTAFKETILGIKSNSRSRKPACKLLRTCTYREGSNGSTAITSETLTQLQL